MSFNSLQAIAECEAVRADIDRLRTMVLDLHQGLADVRMPTPEELAGHDSEVTEKLGLLHVARLRFEDDLRLVDESEAALDRALERIRAGEIFPAEELYGRLLELQQQLSTSDGKNDPGEFDVFRSGEQQ